MAQVQFMGQPASSHIFSMTSSSAPHLVQSHMPPSFAMCPEQITRGFTSMEVTHFVQLPGHIGGTYHRNNIGTCN